KASLETLVLRHVEESIRLDIGIARLAPIGIGNDRGPALRGLCVVSCVEFFGIEPADNVRRRWACAEPKNAVLVERHAVGGEAGIDKRELLVVQIVEGKLAIGAVQRKQLRRNVL